MPARLYFVSDLHFGANYAQATPNREAAFCHFLDNLPNDVEALYILGDLFEFWMEYRTVIPKAHFEVLHALRNLVKRGLTVHYLSGNHDFNLGHFFSKSIGITVHTEPFTLELPGQKCWLLHGDGLAASDKLYRWVKRIMRHPWSNALFKLVHPDWGIELARTLSKSSRDAHGNRPRFMDEYQASAQKLLVKGYSVVMHGHTHCGFVKTLPEGLWINTGEWLQRLEYVEWFEGEFHLRTFHPK